MKSPLTGKQMKLVKEKRTLQFRKDAFNVVYHYFHCEDAGEQFTTDALDYINLNQVYNQYREKYGIPFPDQIISIREKYGVSASKMSEILGLGQNGYRLYESGEMPSVAIGRLILEVQQPENFIKQVLASSNLLNSKEIEKLIFQAKNLIKDTTDWISMKEYALFNAPGVYSGYKPVDLDKIAQMIDFFSKKTGELVKTKLNKLLFYADFGHYKLAGASISGLQYRAIQRGPVPSEYDYLYLKLQAVGKINKDTKVYPDGKDAEVFSGLVVFNASHFLSTEINVLNDVVKKIGAKKTAAVVALSHEEAAWIINEKNKSLISYQYAFDLKHI